MAMSTACSFAAVTLMLRGASVPRSSHDLRSLSRELLLASVHGIELASAGTIWAGIGHEVEIKVPPSTTNAQATMPEEMEPAWPPTIGLRRPAQFCNVAIVRIDKRVKPRKMHKEAVLMAAAPCQTETKAPLPKTAASFKLAARNPYGSS